MKNLHNLQTILLDEEDQSIIYWIGTHNYSIQYIKDRKFKIINNILYEEESAARYTWSISITKEFWIQNNKPSVQSIINKFGL